MKLLLAWEIGAGLGHMATLASLSRHFINKGHQVAYALRDVRTADHFHQSDQYIVYQAPVLGIRGSNIGAAYDCADMLLIRGYEDTDYLKSGVEKWQAIFADYQPDIVVCDHAPSARLASYITGIPSYATGNGFTIPPLTSPLQSLYETKNPDLQRISKNEDRLNTCVNRLLTLYGLQKITRAVEIFYGGFTFIRTFKELDQYPEREDTNFYGMPYDQISGVKAIWPSYSAKKVFIYLYSSDPVLPRLLSVLHQLGIDTLLYSRTDEIPLNFTINSKHIKFSSNPFDISDIKGRCDLIICRGGSNTVAAGLLQGIPLLTFPAHIEQSMTSQSIAKQNLGVSLNQQVNDSTLSAAINYCLTSEELNAATTNFAQKYSGYNSEHAEEAIAQQILNTFVSSIK
jgi:UDP-N-acetylglucosamine:LPS N-acetylglucosamine transferase